MQEDFLHYVWRYLLFKNFNLVSTRGESLVVQAVGKHNRNAGPDFLESIIRIGSTRWAGAVEIHVSSSDWYAHKHHQDPAYNGVVLHVVYEANREVYTQSGQLIPQLEIKDLIRENLYEKYQSLRRSSAAISCGNLFATVPKVVQLDWQDHLIVQRMERKSKQLMELVQFTQGDLEQAFFIQLAKTMGTKVNADAFEQMAKNTPLSLLLRARGNSDTLEALLMGQAGLLKTNPYPDEFWRKLQGEYEYLRRRPGLTPLEQHAMKFLRMRPVNFPTIKLAQLATLIGNEFHLFSGLMSATTVEDARRLLKVETSGYWQTHYVFGRKSAWSRKKLGSAMADLVLINAVIPFLFVQSQRLNDPRYRDRAIELLQQLKPELNSITKSWKSMGATLQSALDSQALLELRNEFCLSKKCLNCRIGSHLLNR